jgi:hypothetical protein
MNQEKINIQIQPDKINAIFADAFGVTRSSFNFTIDLGQNIPQLGMINVFSRISLTPEHAKQLQQLLDSQIKLYEKDFGVINITAQMKEEIAKGGLGFRP